MNLNVNRPVPPLSSQVTILNRGKSSSVSASIHALRKRYGGSATVGEVCRKLGKDGSEFQGVK